MRRSGPTASNEHQLLALSDNERKKKKITRRPTENGSGSFEIEFTIKKKKERSSLQGHGARRNVSGKSEGRRGCRMGTGRMKTRRISRTVTVAGKTSHGFVRSYNLYKRSLL